MTWQSHTAVSRGRPGGGGLQRILTQRAQKKSKPQSARERLPRLSAFSVALAFSATSVLKILSYTRRVKIDSSLVVAVRVREGPPSTTSLSAAKEVVDAGLRRHDDGALLRVSLPGLVLPTCTPRPYRRQAGRSAVSPRPSVAWTRSQPRVSRRISLHNHEIPLSSRRRLEPIRRHAGGIGIQRQAVFQRWKGAAAAIGAIA
jgi:hypothetical protein